jgi:hypothetical protein
MKTHDLGHGWFVNFNDDKSLTVRNPEKSQRIDLSVNSANKLREIIKDAKESNQ